MVLSYGTTITYNGIQWRHNTLQWDQYATTYLARDHNNSQWRTMETQGITMGPMRDNIPCKVTTEHSAFPDDIQKSKYMMIFDFCIFDRATMTGIKPEGWIHRNLQKPLYM